MTAVLIPDLSEETHRALERLASEHGQSVEAEIRAILDDAVNRDAPLSLGTELATLGKRFRGVDLRIVRDRHPIEPAVFD